MENCIFCKIIKEEIPSVKFWEDDEFFAVLDVFPNTKGMTLVIPKKHFDSDTFSMPDVDYTKLMLATKKVSDILKKGLGVNRVAMVAEGMGVNHVHIKLYPLHGIGEEFEEMWAKDKVFFEKYQGYLSTQLGEKAQLKDLRKVAQEIIGKNK